jgi:hypothetical protein
MSASSIDTSRASSRSTSPAYASRSGSSPRRDHRGRDRARPDQLALEVAPRRRQRRACALPRWSPSENPGASVHVWAALHRRSCHRQRALRRGPSGSYRDGDGGNHGAHAVSCGTMRLALPVLALLTACSPHVRNRERFQDALAVDARDDGTSPSKTQAAAERSRVTCGTATATFPFCRWEHLDASLSGLVPAEDPEPPADFTGVCYTSYPPQCQGSGRWGLPDLGEAAASRSRPLSKVRLGEPIVRRTRGGPARNWSSSAASSDESPTAPAQ